MNIQQTIGKFIRKNGPTLLAVGASAGVVATSVLTGKAVLKADVILNDHPEPEQRMNKALKTQIASVYIPPVLCGTATIACIIGAHLMNKRIQAGLIAAYGVLDAAYKSYRLHNPAEADQLVEKWVKEEKVENYISDLLKQRPSEEYSLWVDDYRKRPFWAREVDILNAKDHINKCLLDPNSGRWCVGLEEFYEFVHGEPEPQDTLWGWTESYIWEQWDCYLIEIDWVDDIYKTENGTEIPVRRIKWWCEPTLDYLHYD